MHKCQIGWEESWRMWRIVADFTNGFDRMACLGRAVSIFGSARRSSAQWNSLAFSAAYAVGKQGFHVITGGGNGLMEQANAGAKKAGVRSCGLSIDLPHEECLNKYVDSEYAFRFNYFFARKVMFVHYACAYIALPGGVGTLDELFEAMTLIQTKKAKRFPIALVGVAYWSGLLDWLKNQLLTEGLIDADDLENIYVSDDCEAVAAWIKERVQVDAAQNFDSIVASSSNPEGQ